MTSSPVDSSAHSWTCIFHPPSRHASRTPAKERRSSASASHPDAVPGFVWSSRFGGDWHVVLLFLDRVSLHELHFGTPEPLRLHHPAVLEAAVVLHVDLIER